MSLISNTNKLFKHYTVDIFVSTILIGLSFNLALFIYKVRSVSASPIENQYYFSKELPKSDFLSSRPINNTFLNEKNLPEENNYEISLILGESKEIDITPGMQSETSLPSFIKINENKLFITPTKKI